MNPRATPARTRALQIALAVVFIVALQACGGSDDGGTLKPAVNEAPAERETPADPPPKPTPPSEAASDPPAGTDEKPTDDAARIASGGRSYATLCASCHGATGDAKTPIAANLDPPPTRHDDAAYMDGLSDDYLFEVIKNGGAAVGKSPMMAPWGGALSDDQIRAVVAFMRTLPASANDQRPTAGD
jgi:cytochrome c553